MLHTDPRALPMRSARPRSVVTAARLMIASSAISGLSLLILLLRSDETRRRLRDATPRPSEGAVDTAMTVTTLGYVAFLLLFPLLTRHVTQGRNWARLATWALAGLGVLAALSALGRPQLGVARALGWAGLLVDVAVVALLIAPASTRWFRGR